MTPNATIHINSLDLETLVQREITRCTLRIEECETREAALGAQPDPKLRAANDRDRDRAFVSLRRAISMLKLIPQTTPAPAPAEPVAKPGLYLVPKPEPVSPAPEGEAPEAEPASEAPSAPARQIARNALCPCNSGDKYKRCCGRQAPPLPLRAPTRLPKAA